MTDDFEVFSSGANELVTPCYAYSLTQLRENYGKLKNLLGTDVLISVKANHNTELLQRSLYFITDGFDIASLGELKTLNGSKRSIFINTPNLTADLVTAGLKSRSNFTIDHSGQVAQLRDGLERHRGHDNYIVLRINPWLYSNHNSPTKRKHISHFGMDRSDLTTTLELLKDLPMPVKGIHLFSGSYRFNADSMDIIDIALEVLEDIKNNSDFSIDFINLGGGFDPLSSYSPEDFTPYRNKLKSIPNNIQVVHESGRGIFSDCGFFLTRIASIKVLGDKTYAVCDGGMVQNFLLSKTESKFKRYDSPCLVHRTPSLEPILSNKNSPNEVILVGSTCNREDVIGIYKEDCYTPSIGDLFVFSSCGAYNSSYTVSNFLLLDQAKHYVY